MVGVFISSVVISDSWHLGFLEVLVSIVEFGEQVVN